MSFALRVVVVVSLLLSGFARAESAFPVTLEHKYGSTTINAEPVRVVSVGFSDQDDILALGVKPVAVREWYGDMPYATWPWAQDELGDAQPVVLGSRDLDFEAIAELQPDLIIGVSSGMTEREYQQLSRIAPTLPQSGEYIDYGVPWDVRTRTIGKALGQFEQADALVNRLDARIDALRDSHPEFHGKTAAVAFYYNGDIGAYTSSDLRSRLLVRLGFDIPAAYDDIAGDAFYASFSEERIDLLDVDALIWLSGGDALKTSDALTLRPTLRAYQQGREIFVGDLLAGAYSFFSPLSLDYVLDELVPELALAVDGDPSTLVPSSAQ
ncbi:iron-siderophore ABC transporter substrate-binding protein [Saccharospirillum mangrovi]|uniref:iron-siderophore ABC transporter substrate-binding protein n=1 Tax=Saccharospirillum mangrovi TaxID=2161747 RepID=UPI0018E4F2E4|nr:iron-siderophore ABC transporter substrate-binding protein [Saccharospirillum mangrovi]